MEKTNQFKVYHATDLEIAMAYRYAAIGMPGKQKPNFNADHYRLVAVVDCEDLETAYMLTNHIDSEWWLNKQILFSEKSRSTMVGDVIENPAGDRYFVAPVGFEKVRQ